MRIIHRKSRARRSRCANRTGTPSALQAGQKLRWPDLGALLPGVKVMLKWLQTANASCLDESKQTWSAK
jgi:hypothetical protein